MLANMKTEQRRTSWWMRTVLAAGGLAVLALPAVYLSRAERAAAQLPAAAPAEKESAEPTPAAASEPAAAPEPLQENRSLTPTFAPTPAPANYVPTPARPTQIAEPSVEFYPEPSEGEQRINEALEKKETVNFIEMPLGDVAHYFRDKLGDDVEVQLDDRALVDAGVGSDTPITLTVKNVPVRTILQLMLRNLDLTYLVQDDLLLITTIDKAETELVTRTYPVGDLLADVPVRQGKPGNAPGGGGGGMFAVPDDTAARVAQLPAPSTPRPKAAAIDTQKDYDTLIEAITTTVKPASWDEVGGPGSIVPVPVSSSLVVSQTREVHDEILELLRSLRAAKRASRNSE